MATRALQTVSPAVESSDEIHRIIDEVDLTCAFQPVVDLETQEVFAYESLVRCKVPGFEPPPTLLDAAVPVMLAVVREQLAPLTAKEVNQLSAIMEKLSGA